MQRNMTLAPFIRTGRGVHPQIDFDSLERFYEDNGDDVWNIGSPSDLISWQQLRHWYGIEDAQAIPCDIFVWGTGAPPDLRMTRVGGTPFLPRRMPWPTIGNIVMQFLCQFDFRDSRDLARQTVARELPGDLLLVFAADKTTVLSADSKKLRFVWVSATERDEDILTAEHMPTPTHQFEFVAAWGARYRTVDVPSKWDIAFQIPEDASRGRLWILPVFWATKIGGVPYDSQQIQREVPPNYLCQLTSIQVSDETKWPWVNVEAPLTSGLEENGINAKENCLMIGDMGELTLYLDDDGSVSACG